MIPQKLIIKGFLSYKDPVEIDFTDLHVACIIGRNGAGKSSLLDAMTWALFNNARRRDESIINDVITPHIAEVTFDFIYEDAFYRVVRKRGKSGNVEFLTRASLSDGWSPLTEKTASQTNDLICRTLHMDYETFINVSFFLQGKADKFTGQNPGDRKKILSRILNLEVWDEYKERAAENVKQIESDLRSIEREINDNETELSHEDERKKNLDEIKQKLEFTLERQKAADAAYQNAKTQSDNLEKKKQAVKKLADTETRLHFKYNNAVKQRNQIQTELDGVRKKLENAEKIEADYSALREVKAQLEEQNKKLSALSKLQQQRRLPENRINEAQARLEGELSRGQKEAKDIQQAENKLDDYGVQYQELSLQLQSVEQIAAKLPELRKQRDELTAEQSKAAANGESIQKRLTEKGKEYKKFRDEKSGNCPFCGRVLDSEYHKKYLEQLEAEGRGIRDELNAQDVIITELTEQLSKIHKKVRDAEKADSDERELRTKAARLTSQIENLEERLKAWKENGLPRLRTVETQLREGSFCVEERLMVAELDEKISALNYDEAQKKRLEARCDLLKGAENAYTELEKARASEAGIVQRLNDAEERLESDLKEWQAAQEEYTNEQKELAELSQNVPDVEVAREERDNAQTVVNILQKKQGSAEQLVKSLDICRERLKKLKQESKTNEQLKERWKWLEKSFGKSGIPALLIEQALPEIEDEANNILFDLSNGSMTLRFETQTDYSDSKREDKKETLDIIISDNTGPRAYELLSGGEAFRINFALRLALSRVLAQRTGSRLQTLVIDEGFGSQDDEGRARLVEAIQSVQNHFEKILVITHLDELKDAFPSRIEVTKNENGSHVEVIP